MVVSGAADGLPDVSDVVKDTMDEVGTGEDGRGELVEWDDEDTGDGDVCVEVVGNTGVDIGVDVKVDSDVDVEMGEREKDGDDKIVKDGVNIVPDAADGEVSEVETSELELKAEEDGRLIPVLVLVPVVGPSESEGAETLETNKGQRYKITLREYITLNLIGLRG